MVLLMWAGLAALSTYTHISLNNCFGADTVRDSDHQSRHSLGGGFAQQGTLQDSGPAGLSEYTCHSTSDISGLHRSAAVVRLISLVECRTDKEMKNRWVFDEQD